MRFFLTITLIIVVYDVAYAMWAEIPIHDLADKSELVLVGELIGQTEVILAPSHKKLMIGVIRVEEILKGDKKRTVALIALPHPGGLIKSDDIFYKNGQRGLWCLRLRNKEEAGIFLADHPGRFIPMEHALNKIEEIRKIIKNVN